MSGHAEQRAGGWARLSLLEQLGNVGSEVGRALRATGDRRRLAAERALELFDLTLADPRWRHRGSEIDRAREVFCDAIYGNGVYGDPAGLERYFLQFAVAARLKR